jgi:AAA+ superfamily predicted ATPase
MKEFKDEFNNYIESGMPIIQVVTYEWQRLLGFSVGASRDFDRELFIWSGATGLKKWDNDKSSLVAEDEEMTDPLDIFTWFYDEDREETILIMEDFHPYLGENNYQIIRWGREIARIPAEMKKTLIIQTPFPISVREFDKEIPLLEINLPKEDLMVTLFKRAIEKLDYDSKPNNETDIKDIASSALGMTVMEAEWCFRKIVTEKKRLTKSEIPDIVHEKGQIIKKGGLLEYFHPQGDFSEVGGMDNLKSWLKKRGKAFSTDAKDFGLTPPKGVMLLGVPGCGKSLLAKTIANEWELPLIKFDIGKVFGGIVGESESNMRRALQLAETVAPSILWIDEIEKGLSGMQSSGQTDGGTTSRVFGNLLTWMQDKKEPVFIIATANNIESLPPELLRKGRFDEIFFVDLPSIEERKDIFKIHIKKKKRKASDFDLDLLAKSSVGFSGAEIEEAVSEGMFISYDDGDDLKTQDIEEALKSTYPLSKTMRDTIEHLRKWAKVRARFASNGNSEELPETQEKIPQLKQEKHNPFI